MLREDFLKPLGISVNRLALELHVPATRLHEIVNGRRSITVDTAMRLGRYFHQSPRFWMNLQADHDLQTGEAELAARVRGKSARAKRPDRRESREKTTGSLPVYNHFQCHLQPALNWDPTRFSLH